LTLDEQDFVNEFPFHQEDLLFLSEISITSILKTSKKKVTNHPKKVCFQTDEISENMAKNAPSINTLIYNLKNDVELMFSHSLSTERIIPSVQGDFGTDKLVRVLIDTGATGSVMSERFFQEISNNWTPTQWEKRQVTQFSHVKNASGEIMITLGHYLIPFRIGKSLFLQEFSILQTEDGPLIHKYAAILGMNFTVPNKVVIDCGNQEIMIDNKIYTMTKVPTIAASPKNTFDFEELGLIDLECMQGVKIPARESAIITCKIENDDKHLMIRPQFGNSFTIFIEPCFKEPGVTELDLKVHNLADNDTILDVDELFALETELEGPPPTSLPTDLAIEMTKEERQVEWERILKHVLTKATTLDDENKILLEHLIRKNSDIFRLKTDPPGLVKEYEVTAQLTTANPIYTRQYPLSREDNAEAIKQVNLLIHHNIVERTGSMYNSPILFVNKKVLSSDGQQKQERRMCEDLRNVNKKTEKFSFPIPYIEYTLNKLQGKSFFSTLDILWGFWNIPLSEKSKAIFAFTIETGHFTFNRLPFGWVNAPALFQNFTTTQIMAKLMHCSQVYIDDIIIFSDKVKEHLYHLEQLIHVLRAIGVALKLAKCEFFSSSILFLGHVISKEGVSMDPRKTAILRKAPSPTNQKQVRSVLGSFQYVSKFIPNYAKRAKLLMHLLKNDVPFIWTEEHEAAYQDLKSALIDNMSLAYPDMNLPFIITTDASGYAIGAVLSQVQNGVDRPIYCISRTLKDAELRYSTIEKELLAIIYALDKFRPYIYGRIFKIVTDHRPLIWLCGLNKPHSRLIRWSLIISEYANSVEFIPGKANGFADALSRSPYAEEASENEPAEEGPKANPYLHEKVKNDLIKEDCEDLMAIEYEPEQLEYYPLITPELWTIDESSEEIPKGVHKNYQGRYIITPNNVPNLQHYWVPKAYRKDLIRVFHEVPFSAHQSAEKIILGLKNSLYYWEHMNTEIKQFVGNCGKCQLIHKGRDPSTPVQNMQVAKYPMQRVSLDIVKMDSVSRTRNTNLLVVIDCFSRYVEAYPLATEDAVSVAKKFLREFICRYGVPTEILTDRGANFMGTIFQYICRELRIRKLNTAAYRPQGNAINERVHRTMYNYLRAMVNREGTNWEQRLPYALFIYRITFHKSLGMSPYQALFGSHPVQIGILEPNASTPDKIKQEIRHIHRIQELAEGILIGEQGKRVKWANKKKKLVEYAPGELVKLRNHVRNKLQPFWIGPFEIVRRTGPVNYIIKKDGEERLIHAQHISKWHLESKTELDSLTDDDANDSTEDIPPLIDLSDMENSSTNSPSD